MRYLLAVLLTLMSLPVFAQDMPSPVPYPGYHAPKKRYDRNAPVDPNSPHARRMEAMRRHNMKLCNGGNVFACNSIDALNHTR